MTERSPRITRLLEDLPDGGAQVVDDFWREVTATGTPLVEPAGADSALVTFLWRGEARYTATGWGVQADLSRIPETDIWYATQRLPANLRTLYYLQHGSDAVPDNPSGGGRSHVDLLNPRSVEFPRDRADPNDKAHWASLLELPAAPPEPWSTPQPGVARGSLLHTSLRTTALGGRRRISVYRPAGAPPTPPALLVVFDGYLARRVMRIPTTLDNLTAAGRIPPALAIFVNSPSGARRMRELRPGRAIRHFVTQELMPWARHRWSFTDDRTQRVIAGASLGGLAAAYLGLVASKDFGGVIAQSGSFWWPAPPAPEPEWLTHAYRRRDPLPLRFYLDVGDRETVSTRGDGLDQVTVSRRFRDALVERGYDVTYAEYAGAHDYVNWRRTFADGLVALLGEPAATAAR